MNVYHPSLNPSELEPRITPQPSTKFNYHLSPAVPEVSLIFDKSGDSIISKHGSQNSPLVDRSQSYSAWKSKNFENSDIQPRSNDSSRFLKNYNYNEPKDYNNTECSDNYMIKEATNNCRNLANYGTHKDSKPTGRIPQSDNAREISQSKAIQSMRVRHNAKGRISPTKYENNKYNSQHHINIDEKQSHINRNIINNDNEHFSQNENFNLSSNDGLPEFHPTRNSYSYQSRNQHKVTHYHPTPCYNLPTDNNETVKNLLQIINNQNEQIKSLQTQVDRLLKMQEEALKSRNTCSCLSELSNTQKMLQLNSYNNPNTHNMTPAQQNKLIEANIYNENPKQNQHEIKDSRTNEKSDQQSKKTLLEQKVSIGVMTSFEFTVQNSPFNVEEEQQNLEIQRQYNLGNKNSFNVNDIADNLKRKKNFVGLPQSQLENIVEDSESHMSSSHQQSSNFNTSCIREQDRYKYKNYEIEQRSISPELLYRNSDSPNVAPKKSYETEIRTDSSKNRMLNGDAFIKRQYEHRNSLDNEVEDTNRNIPDFSESFKTEAMPVDKNTISDNKRDEYFRQMKNAIHDNDEILKNELEVQNHFSNGHIKDQGRPLQSPLSNIHVDMNGYCSDNDADKVKRTSKIGWTFYNNILGQVNEILHNTATKDEETEDPIKIIDESNTQRNDYLMKTVKTATLEQLKKLGISLNGQCDSTELTANNKPNYDESYYPKLDYEASMAQPMGSLTDANTSIHMKALALKYLSDEQLSELAVNKQSSSSLKQMMMSNVQGTNMSFATMRYLERYQLLPGREGTQVGVENDVKFQTPKPEIREIKINQLEPQQFPVMQSPRTNCQNKILDISTLKRQPKLL